MVFICFTSLFAGMKSLKAYLSRARESILSVSFFDYVIVCKVLKK